MLWRREGLAGFFRGFGAVALGTIPGQAAYFGGYECGNFVVPDSYGVVGDMGVGCIAQLFAGVAFTPIDIIKERLQVPALLFLVHVARPLDCVLLHLTAAGCSCHTSWLCKL